MRQLSLNDTGSSIKDLHRPNPVINTNPNMKKSRAAPVVADSWEDEDSSSESGPPTPTAHDSVPGAAAEEEEPLDPPPTPISPQLVESHGKHHQAWPTSAYGNPSSASSAAAAAAAGGGGPAGREPPSRRPEKQTAVAGRMIAGALGVRAPKRTEEQRAYDRSVKEQEIRRRNREREEAAKAVEEDEKAKAAVWDD